MCEVVPKKTLHEPSMLCIMVSTDPVLCNATELQTAVECKYTVIEKEKWTLAMAQHFPGDFVLMCM